MLDTFMSYEERAHCTDKDEQRRVCDRVKERRVEKVFSCI